MREFTIKLNARPSNLKIAELSHRDKSGFKERFEEPYENLTPEKQKDRDIKNLKDRLKILEMELQKAREESFRAGYDEGQQSMIQEAHRRTEAMRIEIQSMELKYLEAIEQIEEPLLLISKKMTEKILGMQLSITEDMDQILFNNLRKMLYEVVDQNKVLIQVNPEQLQTMKKRDLVQELNLSKNIELSYSAGNDLRRGEARIQSEDYFIDGSYDNQIQQLSDNMKDEK
jgi:flagellar assembly protein FliH